MGTRYIDLFLEVPEQALDFYVYCRKNYILRTVKIQTATDAPYNGGFEIVVSILDSVIYCRTIKNFTIFCNNSNCGAIIGTQCDICRRADLICEYWLRDIPYDSGRYDIRNLCSFGYKSTSSDETVVKSSNLCFSKRFYQMACREVDKYIELE